jgi:hypothetical protein
MAKIMAIFGQPEDITNIGTFEGKIFRFPVTLIDMNDFGTPRQSSKSTSLRIKTSVTASHNGWGLSDSDLIKVLFEIAKEHLTTHLNSSSSLSSSDLEIAINMSTHKGPCPYEPSMIQEPAGAVVEIESKRRIGF